MQKIYDLLDDNSKNKITINTEQKIHTFTFRLDTQLYDQIKSAQVKFTNDTLLNNITNITELEQSLQQLSLINKEIDSAYAPNNHRHVKVTEVIKVTKQDDLSQC